MQLNTLKPAAHSRARSKRVGRGAGSGLGKTCGRGHKGQHARSGGYHKTGFEGGQMPLQRRLPKVGFRARVTSSRVEVRLGELAAVDADVIDLDVLKKAKIVPACTTRAKVILSGALTKAVTVRGLTLTKGARAAIEAAGGRIAE